VRVHLVVVEKVFKEPSIKQRVTGIELLYKHSYYNKVMVKLNKQQLKLLDNSNNYQLDN
jgi:hypothetical protein